MLNPILVDGVGRRWRGFTQGGRKEDPRQAEVRSGGDRVSMDTHGRSGEAGGGDHDRHGGQAVALAGAGGPSGAGGVAVDADRADLVMSMTGGVVRGGRALQQAVDPTGLTVLSGAELERTVLGTIGDQAAGHGRKRTRRKSRHRRLVSHFDLVCCGTPVPIH